MNTGALIVLLFCGAGPAPVVNGAILVSAPDRGLTIVAPDRGLTITAPDRGLTIVSRGPARGARQP